MVRKYVRGMTPQRKAQVQSVKHTLLHTQRFVLYLWLQFKRNIHTSIPIYLIILLIYFYIVSISSAAVKSPGELHVQRKERKLPLQCV